MGKKNKKQIVRTAQELGQDFVLVAFQGVCYPGKDHWESCTILRNEILSLYFNVRIERMTKENIFYTDAYAAEIPAAHEWFGGLLNAVRRAPGEVETEMRIASSYISRRPATATVRLAS